MKRMLDQKTIDELEKLLSAIQVSNDSVYITKLFASDGVYVSDSGSFLGDGIHIDNLTKIKDNAEVSSPLFPLSEANAGKVLAVNSAGTGVEAVNKYISQSIPTSLLSIFNDAIVDNFESGVSITSEQALEFANFINSTDILLMSGCKLYKTYWNDEAGLYCDGSFGYYSSNMGKLVEISVDIENNLLYASFQEV